MQPDATPEREGAAQEARVAAALGAPRLLTPRCTACGMDLVPGTGPCPAHPDAVVIHILAYGGLARSTTPEPSYLTWSNVLVVLLGFALAFALALWHLGEAP